jgi:uncharacterized protein YyaL (SSP411 family)
MMLRCILLMLCWFTLYCNPSVGSEAPSEQRLLKQFEIRKQWFIDQNILNMGQTPDYINRLVLEDSPYLLRHALQPIHWQPWSNNILALAKKQNQLVYLSIGYDTCHWCHVLANESYIDTDIATVLNNHFINVKIDREILPEVDAKYRLALERMTGNPGWPIQVILTPDGDILWIDSYLSQPSLLSLLKVLSSKWLANPDKLTRKAKSLQNHLFSSQKISLDDFLLPESYARLLEDVMAVLTQEQSHDSPRFLRAEWLLHLLAEYDKTANVEYVDIVKSQVDSFLISPTYDFIDGGMHRYSETGDWEKPHFEKMLYDQAQLIRVLVKLYLITGMTQYIDIANQTIEFVESKMKYNGYYVSSLSALSNDIEGGYYQTTIEDLSRLSDEQQSLFKHSPESKLFSLHSINLPSAKTINALSQLRKDGSPFPMADQKGILSWNALYAIALAEMYSATLDEQIQRKMYQYIDQLNQQFYRDGQLYRIVYDGRTSVDAKLDDYALFIQALLLKYGISGNSNDLALAVKLSHQMGMLVDNTDSLLLAVDDQLPSMVAMAINAYKQLYLATGEPEMTDMMTGLMAKSVQSPLTMSQLSLLSAADKTARNNRSPYFIGRGKGVVNFVTVGKELILQINLAGGWHINSNKPLDKKLIPTTIHFINDDPIKADFPEAKRVSLSFSKNMLSVYDSTIQILLDNQQLQRTRLSIKLNLQMCSDKICLLPETIVLMPPLLLIR